MKKNEAGLLVINEPEFLKFQKSISQYQYLPIIVDGKKIYITWKMIGDAIKEKYGKYINPKSGKILIEPKI